MKFAERLQRFESKCRFIAQKMKMSEIVSAIEIVKKYLKW